MKRSRTKILVAGAALALAANMIVGVPWFVSWPLAAFGLFLLAWGVMPEGVFRAVVLLPKGDLLTTKMVEFSDWIEGAAAHDEDIRSTVRLLIKNQLGELIEEGNRLTDAGALEEDEAQPFIVKARNFVEEVFGEGERVKIHTYHGLISFRSHGITWKREVQFHTLRLTELMERVDTITIDKAVYEKFAPDQDNDTRQIPEP